VAVRSTASKWQAVCKAFCDRASFAVHPSGVAMTRQTTNEARFTHAGTTLLHGAEE
jgi:hypothetical protein